MSAAGTMEYIDGVAAAANLSTLQYRFKIIDSSGDVAANTTAGGVCAGVLQDKPEAAGRACQVARSGQTKIVLGATVAAGAKVASDTTGRAVTATTTQFFMGTILEGGDINEIGSMILNPQAYLP